MQVKLIKSVGEYVAGETHDLDQEIADRLIVLGAAEGEPSAEMTEEKREKILADHQVIDMGNLDG